MDNLRKPLVEVELYYNMLYATDILNSMKGIEKILLEQLEICEFDEDKKNIVITLLQTTKLERKEVLILFSLIKRYIKNIELGKTINEEEYKEDSFRVNNKWLMLCEYTSKVKKTFDQLGLITDDQSGNSAEEF